MKRDFMQKKTGQPTGKRALTALVSLISGAGLPFTGLAVHMLKSDSAAGTLHACTVAHEILGLVFTVSTVWHVILNRKALARHIRHCPGRASRMSREVVWAVVLVGAMLLAGLSHTLFAH
jgi:hypothetical protein